MSKLICAFCRGKDCKYENWKLWTKDTEHPNAIDGLFSNWITSQILATARPSTRLMNEYAIVEKFNQENIKAIINLQQLGEHELCGDGNDPKCGFSYNPQDFMDAGVFHYNFGWVDMSVPTVEYMLNIVQVMSNTLRDPQAKVAVHCHAGLGRTGLTIACYLVYEYNMPPKEAVLVVRKSRPLSLQTRHQVQFVTDFESFLKKLIVVFPFKIVDDKVVVDFPSLDLRQMIYHQRLYYHNDDRKQLNYVLKELETAFCEAILSFSNETARISTLEPIIININNGIFNEVETLSVPLLVDLLGLWFLHLGQPFISMHYLNELEDTISDEDYQSFCLKMRKEIFHTSNCIMDLFRDLSFTPPDLIYSTLFTLSGLMTPNRKHFMTSLETKVRRNIIWKSTLETARLKKKKEEKSADELQVHTLRYLQFLLNFRYERSPILSSPVTVGSEEFGSYFSFTERNQKGQALEEENNSEILELKAFD